MNGVDLQDPVNGQIENVHIVKGCPFRVITSFHGIQLEYYEDVMGPDGQMRRIPMRQDVGKPNPKKNEYVHPLGKAIYDLVMAYEEVGEENLRLLRELSIYPVNVPGEKANEQAGILSEIPSGAGTGERGKGRRGKAG